MLPVYGPDLLEIISPDIWEGSKIKGKNYAVPTLKDMAELAVLNVNVRIAEKYGINYKELNDINKVSEALEKVSKEIETNPDFVPLISYPVGGAHGKTTLPYQQIIWPYGVYFDTENPEVKGDTLEVVNILETPEMKELLNIIHGWNKKGYFNRDLLAPDTGRDYYSEGDWFLGWYGYFPYYEYVESEQLGFKVDVVPTTKQKLTTASLTGAMQAISVVSDHPERALMFLNILNSDPYVRNLIGYGVENVHYELVNGKVSYGNRSSEERYTVWTEMIGNCTILKLMESEPDDKWEYFKEFNENAVPSPILGFYPDRTNIESELAVISSVIKEYQEFLWNGTFDPEIYLPEYIKKIEEAGGDKVKAEIQRQLDEWFKNKK